MNTIKQNLVNVRSHIDTVAQKCGRSSEEITLLAVSKTKPASDIEKQSHVDKLNLAKIMSKKVSTKLIIFLITTP